MALAFYLLAAGLLVLAQQMSDQSWQPFLAMALCAMLMVQGSSLIIGLTRRMWLHVPVLTALSVIIIQYANTVAGVGMSIALGLAFLGILSCAVLMSLTLLNVHGAMLLVGACAVMMMANGLFNHEAIPDSELSLQAVFLTAVAGFVLLALLEWRIRRSAIASFLWFLQRETPGWMQRKREAALNRRLILLTTFHAFLASLLVVSQSAQPQLESLLSVQAMVVILTCVILGGYNQSALAVICMIPLWLLPELAHHLSPDIIDTRLVLACAGLVLVLPRSFRPSLAENFAKSLLQSRHRTQDHSNEQSTLPTQQTDHG